MQLTSGSSTPATPLLADGKTTLEIFAPFPGGVKLNKAEFKKGNIQIVVHNNNPTDGQLAISIPGITKNQKAIPIILNVPAYTISQTQVIDFGNCNYSQPSNQPSSNDGQIWIKASATSSTGFDILSVETYISDFILFSATGYLPMKSMGTQSSQFPLILGNDSNYRDKVVLKTGSLYLNGKYNSLSSDPFNVGVNNLCLVGKRNDSQLTDTLKYNNSSSNSFEFDNTGNYSAVFDENNSNITGFISFLPDSIFVSAEYIMNPENNKSYKTVRSDDTISFTAKFVSKSVLKINQITFTDTTNIDISQDKRDQILNGKGAQLTVDITNAIPLNSWIKVTLTDKDYHPLLVRGNAFIITKNNNGTDSVSIPGSRTDINGNYINSSASSFTITLDSLQIKQFSQNAQHAIITVTVETSNSNYPVIVNAADWIKLNIFGKITYTVKKE